MPKIHTIIVGRYLWLVGLSIAHAPSPAMERLATKDDWMSLPAVSRAAIPCSESSLGPAACAREAVAS